MTERRKDTGFWNHPFVQGLPPMAKLLLDYLWTGPDCNQAGLYYLTTKTIAFDTGIDESQIPELMKLLEPKVKWWPELNLVWPKTFLKRQGRSPKFLVAVGRCLENINHPDIVAEFLDFNKSHYGLEIPYQEGRSSSLPEKEPASKLPVIVDDKLKALVDCYESDIAIATPMVVERLKDSCDRYPDGWFQKAVEEAVRQSKRSLAYVEAILKRWESEGINPFKEVKSGAHQQKSATKLKDFNPRKPLR